MTSPTTPGKVTEETMARLRDDVTKLTRALNVPEGACSDYKLLTRVLANAYTFSLPATPC